MSSKKVFISGSISIKKLNDEVIDSLKNIVNKDYKILIGDAPGVDTLIQEFFSSLNYTNIEVYSISSLPRFISNKDFKTKYISVSSEMKKERERQIQKDKAMSNDSDFSFVLWDGKSKGSYSNILRAIESEKYVKIFYTVKNAFLNSGKVKKEEIEFIYRTHNGYSSSELVEYLKNSGIGFFKKTQDLNKYLLEKKVVKKEGNTYLPMTKFENLLIVEKYKGKVSGVKFKNEFIDWIEENIKKEPVQGELF